MPQDELTERAYEIASELYGALGVGVEAAMRTLEAAPISLPCWQGDDVGGFEVNAATGTAFGGIQATGNYPGKARNGDELRADLEQALALIPGRHRVNLHAIYAETDGRAVERDEIAAEHFARWVDWAKQRGIGLDFNGTFFAHPLAADGFTLASRDEGVRRFWVRHGVACRAIGEHVGRQLGSAAITNVWIPDGSKDTPVDRRGPRERLRQSLDEIFREPLDPRFIRDSVEGKLFGIGSESYVVGSHEFYLGYAIENRKLLCIDSGHFHPTESVADKLSSVLAYLDEILLHLSRGVRWDSDHVVTLIDEPRAIAEEIVRGGFLGRVHIGLDYFDASINRVAAWVIGTRTTQKALLIALLEPIERLRELEAGASGAGGWGLGAGGHRGGDFTGRLAVLEELKTMPFAAVWDYYCLKHDVPIGMAWLDQVNAYERTVLVKRQ
jgi:L-rhamnose isomerase